MSAHVLVVEDDRQLADMIRDFLTTEGFTVALVHHGLEAASAWQKEKPDIILLDWMLPGKSGLDLCRQLYAETNIPVIMTTARDAETDKLLGLELGADDYLTKPFSLRELAARIRSVLRRSTGTGSAATPQRALVEAGPLTIDPEGFKAMCGDTAVELTATEFRILEALARYPDRVFSRLQLMEAVLGDYFEGYERTIDSHISHLRRKLGKVCPNADQLIQTVFGVGYKYVLPEKDQSLDSR